MSRRCLAAPRHAPARIAALAWSVAGPPVPTPARLATCPPIQRPTSLSARPPCRSSKGAGGRTARVPGLPVGRLLEVPEGTYFEVPQGILPEATKEYYEDPVLKVGCCVVWVGGWVCDMCAWCVFVGRVGA